MMGIHKSLVLCHGSAVEVAILSRLYVQCTLYTPPRGKTRSYHIASRSSRKHLPNDIIIFIRWGSLPKPNTRALTCIPPATPLQPCHHREGIEKSPGGGSLKRGCTVDSETAGRMQARPARRRGVSACAQAPRISLTQVRSNLAAAFRPSTGPAPNIHSVLCCIRARPQTGERQE